MLSTNLCVRWARDDPEAMPVRVVPAPTFEAQWTQELVDTMLAEGDWAGVLGTYIRVVEVAHPRAVPIREAREGEPAFRVAFVRPEPGERAEWADPREE